MSSWNQKTYMYQSLGTIAVFIYKVFYKIKTSVLYHLRISRIYTNEMLQYRSYVIGDHTYGSPIIDNYGTNHTVHIWKFCSIWENVQILLAPHHRLDWVSTYPLGTLLWGNKIDGEIVSKWDVIIWNDVRIGKNVVILDGVTIWDGAVIATWAVVTSNVDPYTVVWWVPAKLIKYRFDESTIQRLLCIKRWDRPTAKIIDHIPLLCSWNIDDFLNNA